MEQPSRPHVFAFAGLPGSGKTTAADILGNKLEDDGLDVTHTEVSDFCRSLYKDEHGELTDDNDLGRWTAELKDEYGQGYILREMVQMMFPLESYQIISGLRSPEEAQEVRAAFGAENVSVISIWTLPDIRFKRKYGDNPSEDHPKWDEFQERNEREIHKWGAVKYFMPGGSQDYIVSNNGNLLSLEKDLSIIAAREVFGDDIPAHWKRNWNPFPRDLSEKQVAQYL